MQAGRNCCCLARVACRWQELLRTGGAARRLVRQETVAKVFGHGLFPLL